MNDFKNGRGALWLRGLVYLSILISTLSCNPDEENAELPEAVITLNKTEISFGASGIQETYLKVRSTYAWTIESDSQWLTSASSGGSADREYNVLVSARENTGAEERTGIITIKSGKAVKTVTVRQGKGHITLTPSDVPNYDRIYIPEEYSGSGFLASGSQWYFGRSVQSEHFILFWEPGYGEFGEVTPSECVDSRYRVNIQELLDWAEVCFDYYINTLHFVDYGIGRSQLDKYKFEIFLHHTTEWAAYGWGQDDVVGCLWVNPDAANSRSTVAHEIGHSFQFQVYADQLLNHQTANNATAWRYQEGKGQGFWEQTAQWQSKLLCPDEIFDYNFDVFCKNAHRHFLHEEIRYASYFFHYYWAEKYGLDAVAKVWRIAREPEDALQAYMRCFDIPMSEFNTQLYEYAARCATWDFDGMAEEGVKHLNRIVFNKKSAGQGYYIVSQRSCPEATGFNIIRLKNWSAGDSVKMDITGLPDHEGYNSCGDPGSSGWTIGFAALSDDGNTRYYSSHSVATPSTDNQASVSWAVPEDAKYIWAVVACTPGKYIKHVWDDDDTNDPQWPYKVKFTGADF